jgi:hypothetical protein
VTPRPWRVWRRLIHWSVALARFRRSRRFGKGKGANYRGTNRGKLASVRGRGERKRLPRALLYSPAALPLPRALLYSPAALPFPLVCCPLLPCVHCPLPSIVCCRLCLGSRCPCLPTGREGEAEKEDPAHPREEKEDPACLPSARGLLCSLFLGMLLLSSSQLCLALESWLCFVDTYSDNLDQGVHSLILIQPFAWLGLETWIVVCLIDWFSLKLMYMSYAEMHFLVTHVK